MAKKSTTTALLSFTHNCQKYLDIGKYVCADFFDLSKAFDSVPHRPLLNKISHLGIDPFLVRWTESYLSNRTQSVVLDEVESNPLPVVSGVPQGSILGPMLFLLYIEQAANSVSNSKIVMYADDIALYQSIQDQSDYVQIQEDVNSLYHWIAENHLKLNFSKCCYMTFSRKSLPTEPNTPLTVNNDLPLSRVNNFKYLGATLSVDLTWAKHINSICNKTRKLVGMFYTFTSILTRTPLLSCTSY